MSYIVQHPRSDWTGRNGYIGYVGPFPRSTLVVHDKGEEHFDSCTEARIREYQIDALAFEGEMKCPLPTSTDERRSLCSSYGADKTHAVKFVVSLPMAAEAFTRHAKTMLRESVAAVFNVSTADVKVSKVSTATSAIRALVSVKATNEESGSMMAKTFAIEDISEELSNRGLPEADLLQVPQVVEISSGEQAQTHAQGIGKMQAAVIGFSTGLGVLVLIALGKLLLTPSSQYTQRLP